MAIFPGYGFAPDNVYSYPVVNGLYAVEEGTAMTFSYPLQDGIAKVQVGSASSSDKFAGFAYNQYRILPTNLPKVEEQVIPSTVQEITLTRTPLNPTTQVFVVVISPTGTQTALAYASSADSTHFALSGTTVTFDESFAGYTAHVVYNYTPTALEARDFYGDIRPGTNNTGAVGVISVIRRGTIVLTNYDTGADWSANTAIKVDSTGRLVKSGSGLTLTNAIVRAIPTSQNPYLSVELQ